MALGLDPKPPRRAAADGGRTGRAVQPPPGRRDGSPPWTSDKRRGGAAAAEHLSLGPSRMATFLRWSGSSHRARPPEASSPRCRARACGRSRSWDIRSVAHRRLRDLFGGADGPDRPTRSSVGSDHMAFAVMRRWGFESRPRRLRRRRRSSVRRCPWAGGRPTTSQPCAPADAMVDATVETPDGAHRDMRIRPPPPAHRGPPRRARLHPAPEVTMKGFDPRWRDLPHSSSASPRRSGKARDPHPARDLPETCWCAPPRA